jgi:hypothetical protein
MTPKWDEPYTYLCPGCGHPKTVLWRNRPQKPCRQCSQRQARALKTWVTRGTAHAGSRTPLYRVWHQMLRRCLAPADKWYPSYGGRGITVDEAWKDFVVFRGWALAHGYVPGLFLDRRDNDGPYTPDNCRWVTPATSARNRRGRLSVCEVSAILGRLALGQSYRTIRKAIPIKHSTYWSIKQREHWQGVLPVLPDRV